MWQWMLGVAAVGVVGIAIAQYRAVARSHVPLSRRQPGQNGPGRAVPLGHEALDMEGVLRTQRLHQGLERAPRLWLGSGQTAPDFISPQGLSLPDDETYSARYHAAFQTRKRKDRNK